MFQALANAILATHWQDRALPVEPEVIARARHIQVIDLPEEDRDRYQGHAITSMGREVIYVNPRLIPTRQRFVIAHCLGHIELKHINPPKEMAYHLSSNTVDPMEAEANAFALALMIPSTHLKNRIKNGTHSARELGTIFQMSELSVYVRMKDLKII